MVCVLKLSSCTQLGCGGEFCLPSPENGVTLCILEVKVYGDMGHRRETFGKIGRTSR